MKIIIDGVTIDEDTGEIIEGVEGDALTWAIQAYQNAKLNIRGWEQTQALAKQAMERLLDEAAERSIKTDYGTASLRAGRDTIDSAGLKAAIATAEMTDGERLDFFQSCAGGFGTKKTRDWLVKAGLLSLLDGLVSHGDGWVHVDPPRAAPPDRKVAP